MSEFKVDSREIISDREALDIYSNCRSPLTCDGLRALIDETLKRARAAWGVTGRRVGGFVTALTYEHMQKDGTAVYFTNGRHDGLFSSCNDTPATLYISDPAPKTRDRVVEGFGKDYGNGVVRFWEPGSSSKPIDANPATLTIHDPAPKPSAEERIERAIKAHRDGCHNGCPCPVGYYSASCNMARILRGEGE